MRHDSVDIRLAEFFDVLPLAFLRQKYSTRFFPNRDSVGRAHSSRQQIGHLVKGDYFTGRIEKGIAAENQLDIFSQRQNPFAEDKAKDSVVAIVFG